MIEKSLAFIIVCLGTAGGIYLSMHLVNGALGLCS